MDLIKKIYDIHDIECNQKYGDELPYSFHLKAVLAQGLKFKELFFEILNYKVKEQKIYLMKDKFEFFLSTCLVGHDLIEDGRYTYNDVRKLANDYFFPPAAESIADIIYDVTDGKGKDRWERKDEKYYEALKENKLALFVKLSDMAANRMFSKLFNTRQYSTYVNEFAKFKEKTYCDELGELFDYVENI